MDLDDIYRIDGYLSGQAIASEIIDRANDPNIIYRTNDTVLDTDAVKELAKYITRLKYENETLKGFTSGIFNGDIEEECILTQEVRDKIKELKAQYEIALDENSTKAFILKCQITILQELLESEE